MQSFGYSRVGSIVPYQSTNSLDVALLKKLGLETNITRPSITFFFNLLVFRDREMSFGALHQCLFCVSGSSPKQPDIYMSWSLVWSAALRQWRLHWIVTVGWCWAKPGVWVQPKGSSLNFSNMALAFQCFHSNYPACFITSSSHHVYCLLLYGANPMPVNLNKMFPFQRDVSGTF